MALVMCINDTSASRKHIRKLRKDGEDVIHIPPPEGVPDWEMWVTSLGDNRVKIVREHIISVLRSLGREELIESMPVK